MSVLRCADRATSGLTPAGHTLHAEDCPLHRCHTCACSQHSRLAGGMTKHGAEEGADYRQERRGREATSAGYVTVVRRSCVRASEGVRASSVAEGATVVCQQSFAKLPEREISSGPGQLDSSCLQPRTMAQRTTTTSCCNGDVHFRVAGRLHFPGSKRRPNHRSHRLRPCRDVFSFSDVLRMQQWKSASISLSTRPLRFFQGGREGPGLCAVTPLTLHRDPNRAQPLRV